MVNAVTIGILLPTTAYILRLKYPPARKMIDKGMAIALGSDFNPNAYCMSMVSESCDGMASSCHCISSYHVTIHVCLGIKSCDYL